MPIKSPELIQLRPLYGGTAWPYNLGSLYLVIKEFINSESNFLEFSRQRMFYKSYEGYIVGKPS